MQQTGIAEGIRHARAIGVRLDDRRRGGVVTPTYGPNLFPVGAFTITGTGIVDNGDGTFTCTGASNAATAGKSLTLEAFTTYLAEYDISASLGTGGIKTQTYGPATNELGQGTPHAANGHYSEEITTGGAGTLTNQHRFQCTGASGGANTFTISGISLKKKLS